MKSLLDLDNNEAKDFFLKESSYCGIDLPSYFYFQKLIQDISHLDASHFDWKGKHKPCKYSDVNYTIINNKDGLYAWRPLQIIHPAIYVNLITTITEKENWQTILDVLKKHRENKKIKCISIPLRSDDSQSDKATSIITWWKEIEQESIKLSLTYRFLFQTDIIDCYGAIYTHSIAWALHTKEIAKKNHSSKLIGNKIDEIIRGMTNGQTNGIPQGSTVMDFIAEIVLSYIDSLLSNKIDEVPIKSYTILRYRDDYRIFTQNKQDAEIIIKFLTEILISMGMKLNPHKTEASENIIKAAIKPDKLYWIGKKKPFRGLQEHLLHIHHLAEVYPNSGSLIKALMDFFDRLSRFKKIKEDQTAMIAILVDIMLKNPKAYPQAAANLSLLLKRFDRDDVKTKIIDDIIEKCRQIPNTGYLEIWLQRSAIKYYNASQFSERLCKKVTDCSIEIWRTDWMPDGILKEIIKKSEIIDYDRISNLDEAIQRNEIELFKNILYS